MANKPLESSAISAFCSSIATMLAAGVQTDEAVHMLSENRKQSNFKRVCDEIYSSLVSGDNLAESMESTGAFPAYAIEMVRVGESSGRTERVLRSLGHYYESERRTFAKLQSSIGYPAALLCVMSIILLFTVILILPIFTQAYESMSGSLTSGSFNIVNASVIIGWVALIVILIATIAALIISALTHSENGRSHVTKLLQKFPGTKQAIYELALSRFTNALAAFIASGVQEEAALRQAMKTVDHPDLKEKLKATLDDMIDLDNPRSLGQAIVENEIFEPIYGRMLLMSTRSGSTDEVLEHLSDLFFDDANAQLDAAVDTVEPSLAAFLTIAVGATLIAVMLPLIGIMGSIA